MDVDITGLGQISQEGEAGLSHLWHRVLQTQQIKKAESGMALDSVPGHTGRGGA